MITARYWRLLAADTSYNTTPGTYHWNLIETYLYTSADCSGTRLSVGTTAESTKYTASYPGSNTQDGNTGTFWSTLWNQASPQWVSYDFGSGNSYAIGSISLLCSANAAGMYGPKKISVQYSSDNSSWTTLITADIANATTQPITRQILDIQAAAVGRPIITPASPLGAGRMIHTLGR